MDVMHPHACRAMLNILKRLRISVFIPRGQTCCGQPAYNAGYWKEAARVARHFLAVFHKAPVIVCPSGSCVDMVRHQYPVLFQKDSLWLKRSQETGARLFEFTEFLVDVMGITDTGAFYPGKVTYHDSCHLARGLGIREQPRILIRHVRGVEFLEMKDPDRCCGFGGGFSVAYPEISTALVDDKIRLIQASGADTVVGCDMGCLMNIEGRLSRLQSPIRVMHIVELLAGQNSEKTA
jgi:L-lactate dehydrogenase complex protein LldE